VKRQIRKHARVFAAILFLFVGALALAGYLLSNQRFYLPGWVPVIGTEFFELEAELPTAQAVVPGQGQTVNIAGVHVRQARRGRPCAGVEHAAGRGRRRGAGAARHRHA